jgi:6-phosphofructokinase 1
MKRYRLGLCTGGGDCPGLNAVIHAVVRHAVGIHGMEIVGVRDGLTGLIEEPNAVMPLTMRDVAGIHDRGGTILGTTNKGSPFRHKDRGEKILRRITESWKAQHLDALIVIGGDGTHFMSRTLVESGLHVVGVPKTIDNDLHGTDHTVGFATAVDIATDAAGRLGSSADAHNRIMILEVMGRDAGHIALHAGIAAAADVVLLPEIPFSYDAIEARVRERQLLGRNALLMVIAEGAHEKGKAQAYKESNGVKMLGGISHRVAAEIGKRTGVDVRVTILGHIQRGGTPNAIDRVLASMMGTHAVELVARKKFGRIVAVSKGRLTDFPYAKVEDSRRLVELDGEHVRTAEAMGICLGRKTGWKA